MDQKKIKIGITHGDINGVSYEIILKTLMDTGILDLCIPIVYGSSKVAAYYKKVLNIEDFNFNVIHSVNEANDKRANIINCTEDEIRVDMGQSTQTAGKAAFDALEAAVNDLKDDKIKALVTAPINKYNIQSEKFRFSGHTEYLQSVFGSEEVLMLMVSNLLKVGVVTGHVPMAEVIHYIKKDNILAKIRILNDSLIQDFTIRRPKIAVLGFNPHAGDNGLLGKEEETEIIPAISEANDEKILTFGPFPADGFFGSGKFAKFDAVLAMYHDQGLTPFKTLVSNEGVNYTAGLPVIRTSPAHGTAYDAVGKDEALHGSVRSAIYLACDIYKSREMFKEFNNNPLPFGLPEELQTARE